MAAKEFYTNIDLKNNELQNASNVPNAISMTLNSETYEITVALKNGNTTIGSAQTIDLPLEELVVSGQYDSVTKKIILTLKSGDTIYISVSDLVDGLIAKVKDNEPFNNTLKAGCNYTLGSISSLTVTTIQDGDLESNVFFTVSGSNFNPTLPNNVKVIGELPEFESGEQYVMSYYRSTVVFGKLSSL